MNRNGNRNNGEQYYKRMSVHEMKEDYFRCFNKIRVYLLLILSHDIRIEQHMYDNLSITPPSFKVGASVAES
jgi:hypothetical protein